MNEFIARKVLGRDPSRDEASVILDEYANTSSAGSVIDFHKYHDDLAAGDIAVLCAFGAGYSAGSVVMKRLYNLAAHRKIHERTTDSRVGPAEDRKRAGEGER